MKDRPAKYRVWFANEDRPSVLTEGGLKRLRERANTFYIPIRHVEEIK